MAIFEEIVRTHYTRLLAYTRSIVKGDTAAQDVVQEVFIAAYKSFGGYQEQGKVFPWLKTIARNAAFRYLQKESRFICHAPEDEDIWVNVAGPAHIQDDYIGSEGERLILAAINNLPPHQRQVVYHRVVDGMGVSEVSARLNISAGSVKSKTHYGLAKVKTELKNYLIEGAFIMDCKKAYEYLFQYAKGAILAADKSKVEKHLEVCKGCKDIAESLKKLVPHIKPAPEGMMRHYNISFQVEGGLVLGYYGSTNHIANYERLNKALEATGGSIPEGEIWFRSGFGGGTVHIAEFDNEGNRIEVEIGDQEIPGHKSISYKKMVKVFEYHQINSVSLSEDVYGSYQKSLDAPNLYIAKTQNTYGQPVRSGLYIAIPGKATNVRMKQGVDVVDCGAYLFAFDDRYVTESQAVRVECTYNM